MASKEEVQNACFPQMRRGKVLETAGGSICNEITIL